MRFLVLFFIFFNSILPQDQKLNPLEANKFETPRETFVVFIKAMNDYKKGLETKDQKLLNELDTAVRCLNLEGISYLLRSEKGREAAIFLKEVIDRIEVVDPNSIPETTKPPEVPLTKWTLEKTEIAISIVESGDRKNEFLFSRDTVYRATEFYKKTKHLPFLKNSGKGAGYEDPWSEKYLPEFSKVKIFQVYLWQIFGLIIAIILGLFLRVVTKFISKIFLKIIIRVPDSKIKWKDRVIVFLDKPLSQLVIIGFWFFCLNILDFEGAVLKFLSIILQVWLSINIVRFFYDLSLAFTEYLEQLSHEKRNDDFILDSQVIPFISRSTRIVVLIIGTLVTIQNLGINIMSILAGLGVGGLAFALAARDMAANLFGSIMILLDRPFKIGDQVFINGIEGDVEEIGFRCTRVRTFNDSIVSIPNAEVANAKVENLSLRRKKRVHFSFHLLPSTKGVKVEAVLEGIKQIVLNYSEVKKEDIHIVLKSISSLGSEISVSFYCNFKDWYDDHIIKQNVSLDILELLDYLGISMVEKLNENEFDGNENEKEEALDEISTEELIDKVRKYKNHEKGFGIYSYPKKDK